MREYSKGGYQILDLSSVEYDTPTVVKGIYEKVKKFYENAKPILLKLKNVTMFTEIVETISAEDPASETETHYVMRANDTYSISYEYDDDYIKSVEIAKSYVVDVGLYYHGSTSDTVDTVDIHALD